MGYDYLLSKIYIQHFDQERRASIFFGDKSASRIERRYYRYEVLRSNVDSQEVYNIKPRSLVVYQCQTTVIVLIRKTTRKHNVLGPSPRLFFGIRKRAIAFETRDGEDGIQGQSVACR